MYKEDIYFDLNWSRKCIFNKHESYSMIDNPLLSWPKRFLNKYMHNFFMLHTQGSSWEVRTSQNYFLKNFFINDPFATKF